MERRKVIQQGKGTLTMSLPTKWVKQVHIKAGDELLIEEQGLRLVIGTTLQKRNNKTTIDVGTLLPTLVYSLLQNRYIRGDDEIIVTYHTPEQYEAIIHEVQWLIGFEIVEHTKNVCILKELARSDHENFDQLLRRVYLILLGMSEDGIIAMQKKDFAMIKTIGKRDDSINRLISYCLRVLHKHSDVDLQKSMYLHTLLNFLEALGDQYSRFYVGSDRFSSVIIELAKRVSNFLRHFYELSYTFDIEKVNSLRIERDSIRAEIDKKLHKTTAKDDFLSLFHLRRIADLIMDIEKFQIAMQV